MRIGILGSGLMGGKLGTLWARAGREKAEKALKPADFHRKIPPLGVVVAARDRSEFAAVMSHYNHFMFAWRLSRCGNHNLCLA